MTTRTPRRGTELRRFRCSRAGRWSRVFALVISSGCFAGFSKADVAQDSASLWTQAEVAERVGFIDESDDPTAASVSFRRASELFVEAARARDHAEDASAAYWRGARSIWLAADALGDAATEERIAYYERAEALAQQGIEIDPECAPCMLWKFSSMGRLATTRGIWTAAKQVPEMAELLDRAIALEPDDADTLPGIDNSVLGNLHYSSAIFYRLTPDWFLIRLLLGVRGDKNRALGHIEKALELHPLRMDYQVELGSQYLCMGTTDRDAGKLERGRKQLHRVVERIPESLDDAREIAAAKIMLEDPTKACGYSGDTWIEVDRAKIGKALSE